MIAIPSNRVPHTITIEIKAKFLVQKMVKSRKVLDYPKFLDLNRLEVLVKIKIYKLKDAIYLEQKTKFIRQAQN